MARLALSIVIGRMQSGKSPFTERLALLQDAVRDTLADLEGLVRTEALALGVPQEELEEHVGVCVGMATRRAVEGVLEEVRKARAQAARDAAATSDIE